MGEGDRGWGLIIFPFPRMGEGDRGWGLNNSPSPGWGRGQGIGADGGAQKDTYQMGFSYYLAHFQPLALVNIRITFSNSRNDVWILLIIDHYCSNGRVIHGRQVADAVVMLNLEMDHSSLRQRMESPS